MADQKQGWVRIGEVLTRKDGTGSYVKIKPRDTTNKLDLAEITLKAGMIVQVQDPRKRPGITEEQAAKIPDFVKLELVLPPAKE